jgi:MFS family permease
VIFGSGATTFGLLNTVLAIGSLGGAVFSARRADITVRYLCGGALSLGAASVGAGVAPSLGWYALALLPLGYLSQTSTNPAFALMQILVTEERRGRIAAVAMTCLMGGMAVSAPVFGLVADVISPRACLLIGGVGAVLGSGVAYGWYRRHMRRAEQCLAVPR